MRGFAWKIAAAAAAAGAVACEATGPRLPRADDRYEACDASADLEAARALIARAQYAQALPHLRAVLAQCPEHMETHILYQDVARDAGPQATREMLELYAEVRPSSPAWLYAQARLEPYAADQLDVLKEALALDPSFYWANFAVARIRRNAGHTDLALDALDRALAAAPSFAPARLERAEILAELGRSEEAQAEYANYLRARPNDRRALGDYVRLLIYRLARVDLAAPIVERQLADDPGDIDAQMNMAAIEWERGRLDAAIRRYRQVVQAHPTAARAVLNLANVYFERGQRQRGMRAAAWAKAQRAYLYFRMVAEGRAESRYDYWDYYLTVPYRLKQIAEVIGEYQGEAPALADL